MPPKRRATASKEQPFDADSQRLASSRGASALATGSQAPASRRRPTGKTVRGGSSLRRSAAGRAHESDRIAPEVLQENSAKRGWPSDSEDNGRAAKRNKRKGKQVAVVPGSDGGGDAGNDVPQHFGNRNQLNAGDDDDGDDDDGDDGEGDESQSDSDEDSDIAWEDVDLSARPINMRDIVQAHEQPPLSNAATLELLLDDPATRKAADPRRKITAVERRIRLETHKLHLICLVYHVYLRSRWCDDVEIKKTLRPILPKTAYDKLHHNPSDQQFRRSKLFIEGLREASDSLRGKFLPTCNGLTAPHWQDLDILKKWSPPRGIELMSKSDFINASKIVSGSRDVGAQLFCALLRSAGITTRLVCSLQVLPFSFAAKAPKKVQATGISVPSDDNKEPPVVQRRSGGLRRPPLRIPAFASKPKLKPTKSEPQRAIESPYPVYWIEAWSIPSQKWITVDPLVSNTVGRPHLLEPPQSDPLNTLTYVLAIEESGHIADVTRRYAKHFTAKTRRFRVTSTKGGEKWYSHLLQAFDRGFKIDRDQLEEAELAQRQLSEPVPNSVAGFKDHPLFALKRHLRRNQVIHPERKVGTANTGKGKTETIYRRQDVKEVKTREQWYKLGRRDVPDSIPLKFTAPRRRAREQRRREEKEEEEAEQDERPHQPMFSFQQTTLYTPPPVVDGLVPKNTFGNLDIFVPTMVPPGGAHIPDKRALTAARLLAIDFAEAVTGFEFRNRMASPVVKGVVVASEYKEAVEAVVQGLVDEEERAEERRRGGEALALWRRWLLRLRIRERLGIGRDEIVPGIPMERGAVDEDMRREDDEEDEEDVGIHDRKGKRDLKEVVRESGGGGFQEGGGFLQQEKEGDSNGGPLLKGGEKADGGFIAELDQGGGFLPDEDYGGGGGGFIADQSGGFVPDPDDDGGGGVFPPDAGTGRESSPSPDQSVPPGESEEEDELLASEEDDEDPDWGLFGL